MPGEIPRVGTPIENPKNENGLSEIEVLGMIFLWNHLTGTWDTLLK